MSCIVCGANSSDLLFRKAGCAIRRCDTCGLVHVDPLPTEEDLTAYYTGGYYGSAAQGVNAQNGAGGSANARERADGVARRVFSPTVPWWKKVRYAVRGWSYLRLLDRGRERRVLEVGCGQGKNLEALNLFRGVEVEGLEPSEAAAEYAARRGQLVRQGLLREQQYPPDRFDLVLYLHVIEHVRDPLAELAEVRRVLRPGGLLVLHTPDVSHVRARRAGAGWKHLKPPRHLWFFSPDTLGRLLVKAGFSVERSATELLRPNLKVIARKPPGAKG